MAIAIPLIMGAAGASAATIAVVSIAFAVTGVNDRINSAASEVFGKDLVGLANIAGMVYGAASASGALGGAESTVGINGMEAVPTEGMDAFNLAESAQGAESLGESILSSDMSLAAPAYSDAPVDMAGFNLADAANAASGPPQGLRDSLSTPRQPDSTVSRGSGAETAPPDNSLQGMQQNAPQNIPQVQAPQEISNVTQRAARDVVTRGGATTQNATAARGSNLFGLSDGTMQLGGTILRGAAGAYQAAQARRDATEVRDDARRRYEQEMATRNLGGAGFRQTR